MKPSTKKLIALDNFLAPRIEVAFWSVSLITVVLILSILFR
jgi:hypothetical protein